MKIIPFVLLSFLFIGYVQAQTIEPQFKFYLAFEDATTQRDTVWFGMDDSATTNALDPIFADTFYHRNSSGFKVYFNKIDSFYLNTRIQSTNDISWQSFVYAESYELPVKIKWPVYDFYSNSFANKLKLAWLWNNNFVDVSPVSLNDTAQFMYVNPVVMAFSDSLILYDYYNQFPLDLILSRSWPGGIELFETSEVSIFPNPFKDRFTIELNDADLNAKVQLLNMNGMILLSERLDSENNELHTHLIPTGVYTLIVETKNEFFCQKVIKL